MKNFSILILAMAFCLFTHEAKGQDKTPPKTKILDEKTWAWEPTSEFNYAKYADLAFEVGMGNEKNGVGIAEVGLEIENVQKFSVSVDASPFFTRHDDNSFAGFMVDYHTAGGYTKRVALPMGFYSQKKWGKNPGWGTVTVPDQFVDLGKKKEYDLDLKEWAPDGWDGTVWFSVSLQNSGKNTKLKGKILLPSESDIILTTKLIGRFIMSCAEIPGTETSWEFTKEGRAIENGKDMGTWRVVGGKVIITYSDKRWGLAVLSFKNEDTLVGKNEHKNGDVFNWELKKEKTEIAQKPKEEPGKDTKVASDPDAIVTTLVSEMNRLASSLRNVKDNQSLEKLTDAIPRFVDNMSELISKAEKLPPLTDQNKENLRKKHSKAIRTAFLEFLDANKVFEQSLTRLIQEKTLSPDAIQQVAGSFKKLARLPDLQRNGVIASWQLFVPKDSDITWDYYPLPEGKSRIFETEMKSQDNPGFRTILRDKYTYKKGAVERTLLSTQGQFDGQKPIDLGVKGSSQEFPIRENLGFIEIGMPEKGGTAWQPILKLLATDGESWEWKSADKTFKYEVKVGLKHKGRPAVQVTRTHRSDGFESIDKITYVRGVGEVEAIRTMIKEGKPFGSDVKKLVEEPQDQPKDPGQPAKGVDHIDPGVKEKGDTNAEKIVGVWVLSKSEAGGTLGDTMEFGKDGKLTITATLPVGKVAANLVYKIEGDKLTWTLKGPPRDSTEILTIKSLKDSVLVTVDSKDRSQEFTRKGSTGKAVIEPSDEQLRAAIKAFEERKCTLFKHQDPHTKRTSYYFTLPKDATDFSLSQLPDVPFSFGLVLNDTNVSDAGLGHLARSKNLTELLILKSFHISDAGMKDIAKLKLTSLFVGSVQVTDTGLKELAKLDMLTDLSFQDAKITDAGLKELVHFKSLTAISVVSPLVTDKGLKELAKLTHLTGVGLATTKVTDAGLKELTPLTNLRRLNLVETQVTDSGLKEIASLKNLTWLSLEKTQVTSDGLRFIRLALPKCEILPSETPQKTGSKPKAIDLLFPLEGVTLGKTTADELARLGKRPDKNIYKGIWHQFFVVNGINVWHDEGNVACSINLTVYQKMPESWQKLGLDFRLSYDGWLRLFADLGWEVKVLKQPKVVKHEFQKNNSLNAEVLATSGEIEMRLVFDGGKGETTAASDTLYSLGVHAKISPSPLTPQQKMAIGDIEKMGGKVTYDGAEPGKRVAAVSFKGTQVDDAGLKLLIPLTTIARLDLYDTKVTDAGLQNLTSLRNLSSLVLNGTQVTDGGLKELKAFDNLSLLSLCRSRITDAGLKELASLTNLSSLSLDDTQVTDGGLKSLASLKEKLSFLSLSGTKVTDAGLKDLAALKRLTYLELRHTQVTETGIIFIRKQLPFSTIPFDR